MKIRKWYQNRPKREPARFTDHLIGWSTLVMTFATISIAILADLQYKEMQRSGEETKKLIAAAKQQAAAADSFSGSAASINQQMKDAVTDFQRPYVYAVPHNLDILSAVEGRRLNEQLRTQHQLSVSINLLNGGISPAIYTTNKPQLHVGANALNIARKCVISYPSSGGRGLIIPMGSNATLASAAILGVVETPVLKDDEIKRINSGEYKVVVFGGVKYRGVRGGDFLTNYCFIYNPTGIPFSPCGFCDQTN